MATGPRGRARLAVALTLLPALPACVALTEENLVARPERDTAGATTATRWRSIEGGFLGGPSPLTGVPVRPGVGAYVRLVAPAAVALRGNDVLLVDVGAARVYRYDVALNALITIAGAPATPQTRVALGGDLSAYVLDASAGRLLRFARDGRLLQNFRTEIAGTPADFALGRDGVSIQLVDRTLMQLTAITTVGASVLPLRPRDASGSAAGALVAIAIGREGTYVLEASGLVLLVDRDGRIQRAFGQGQLSLPTALAVDRRERVYVVEPAARAIKVFADGKLLQTFGAADLRVLSIGDIAVDEDVLAVSDPEAGRIVLFSLRAEAAR